MLTKSIPSTGERLPIIGLGTYRAFNISLDHSNKQLNSVLNIFFKAGGKLIDSSPMYGNSETIIGRLLKDNDPFIKPFLATKVWTNGKKSGLKEMSQSLRNMGCSKIDLMQVHNLVDADTHLETLKEWRKDGKIKYIGITHHTHNAFNELADYLKKYPEIDFCQFPYSIARREAENYFLDLCHDLGVATLINRPFEQDDLFKSVQNVPLPDWTTELGCLTWPQFFLKYVLGNKASTCAIPATGNPIHMTDNLNAGIGRLPDKKEIKRMANFFEAI